MKTVETLIVTLGELSAENPPPRVEIELTPDSGWSRLLGAWPLPADGTLDRLAMAMEQRAAPPERVSLLGCPSACLLPIVWLRTVWLDPAARIRIDWGRVQDPALQPGRQEACLLACALADEVCCADEARALACWGYESNQAGGARRSAEAFELLTGLFDRWSIGPRHSNSSQGWVRAARRELLACAAMGLTRVALYGAGTHTRALGEVLMEPGVEIVGIIDDDPRRAGTRLWGYTIISPDDALSLGLDAIVLSANSIEDVLWAKTARHREAGIRVVRLYGGDGLAEEPLAFPRQSVAAGPGLEPALRPAV